MAWSYSPEVGVGDPGELVEGLLVGKIGDQLFVDGDGLFQGAGRGQIRGVARPQVAVFGFDGQGALVIGPGLGLASRRVEDPRGDGQRVDILGIERERLFHRLEGLAGLAGKEVSMAEADEKDLGVRHPGDAPGQGFHGPIEAAQPRLHQGQVDIALRRIRDLRDDLPIDPLGVGKFFLELERLRLLDELEQSDLVLRVGSRGARLGRGKIDVPEGAEPFPVIRPDDRLARPAGGPGQPGGGALFRVFSGARPPWTATNR